MDLFWLKVAASFFVGGTYIAFTMRVSEKFGPKIGGLVIGMPSTVMMGLFFICWTAGTQAASDAALVGVAGNSICAVFAALFAHARKRLGIAQSYLIAIGVWLALSAPLALFHVSSLPLVLALAAALFAAAFYMVNDFPHGKAALSHPSLAESAGRSAFAGGVISSSVLAARFMGPLWGGIMATFPAGFSATFILLSRKHGAEFTSAVARTMPHGCLASAAFALTFHFAAVPLGLIGAVAVSYTVATAVAFVLYKTVLAK